LKFLRQIQGEVSVSKSITLVQKTVRAALLLAVLCAGCSLQPSAPPPTATLIPTSMPASPVFTATPAVTLAPTRIPIETPSLTAMPASLFSFGTSGMAVDAAGNLYIAVFGIHVYKLDTAGLVTRFAGADTGGFAGDGGPAIAAKFLYALALAVGPDGSVYVADYCNNRVRRIDPAGIVSTFAGGGGPIGCAGGAFTIFAGDGGPATEASMKQPTGVVADHDGNLYIVDGHNGRIRKVGLDGIITTYAGNGLAGHDGDGGPATEASLIMGELAIDGAGNLYLSDFNRIRKIDPSGIISTFAEDFAAPATDHAYFLAVDPDDNLYAVDYAGHKVLRFDQNGLPTTFAGSGGIGFSGDGGPATAAEFGDEIGPITFDADGNLYIADGHNGRIRKVDLNGVITTIAGRD
jgi:DNA-binding beta-propeller fold protein YncE